MKQANEQIEQKIELLQEDAARITAKQRELAHTEKVIDNKIKANKKEIENLFADEKPTPAKPQSKEADKLFNDLW